MEASRSARPALAVGAGVMLAVHFWTWNASVTMTTVAASVVLCQSSTGNRGCVVGDLAQEPPARRQWIGIAVDARGTAVRCPLFGERGHTARHPLAGDVLAVIGRSPPRSTTSPGGASVQPSISGRMCRSYMEVALALIGFALPVHAPVREQPPREMAIFAALAIGPMLLGHTGLNWALKHLPAYVVNVTLLGEPVGATILAAALPGIREVPPV